MLYFSNPSNPSYKRYNMTVHVSRDEGASWRLFQTIDPGRVGYSALGLLPGGAAVGMLYEHADESGPIFVPTAISFVSFPRLQSAAHSFTGT